MVKDLMMKILFCGETFLSAPDLLRKLLPQHDVRSCKVEKLPELARYSDVLVPLMARVDRSMMVESAVKLIQQWGVGLEGVDIQAANEFGIPVCNIPGDTTPNAESTAEHAIFLMMGVSRKIHECRKSLQEGIVGRPMGETLFGKTGLIVGFGKIGRALTKRMRSLGMEVDVIRRTPDKRLESEMCLRKVGNTSDLLEMAQEVDFVISTVVLNSGTYNLFDMRLFNSMRDTAFVINVSRGPVVNEDDLVKALNEDVIAGAGLDVFTTEPVDPSHPLLSMENVFATPHIGGVTRQNYEAIGQKVQENILILSRGEIPNHCVNLESLQEKQGNAGQPVTQSFWRF